MRRKTERAASDRTAETASGGRAFHPIEHTQPDPSPGDRGCFFFPADAGRETAAEILDEDGVVCIEEDCEIGALGEENTGIDSYEPDETWNLKMLHADEVGQEPSNQEEQKVKI